MTFAELMLKRFPKSNLKNLFVDCCPCNFGVETKMTKFCDKNGHCIDDCSICWNSEIIGEVPLSVIEKTNIWEK